MNILTDCNECEFYWQCNEDMPNKPCEELKKEFNEKYGSKQED